MKVKKCKALAVAALSPTRAFAAAVGVLIVLLGASSGTGWAQQKSSKLTIAAAADLQFAMSEIEQEFERQTGADVTVIYGSSGNLFTQVQNGAPYDVFMSADMEYPRKMVSSHLADPNSLYRYAVGRLVLWVPNSSPLDLKALGMRALTEPSVHKIAIANPQHAPYGRAAVAALKYLKLYEKVSGKLVTGENATQAAQFVQSGNAQLGILPQSLVFYPGLKVGGAYFLVPPESYPVLDQGVVILRKAANRQLADAFLAFLKRPDTGQLLMKYGFVEPPRSLGP